MKHVLITDDNNAIYTMISKALRSRYEVSPIPSNIELHDYLPNHPADLYILHVPEDRTSIFQTFDIIRTIPGIKDKPILFLSEKVDEELEQKLLALGAMDYITLPVSEVLLLHKVNDMIELAELRRERSYVERYQDAISISFAELVECRDVTTGGHLKNTTRYFDILLHAAMESESYRGMIAPEEVPVLLRSAALHDIGKIGINDDILRKESTLNYNEFEYMKTHTTLGKQAFEKIIKETGGTGWLYIAMDMAYCHHEKWDGTGYPNGLKGEEIPLYARMLTIADVYDALTSVRAYKEAFSHQKAMEMIIEGRGSCFDPALVDILITVDKKFEKQLLENKKH